MGKLLIFNLKINIALLNIKTATKLKMQFLDLMEQILKVILFELN